MAPGGLDACSAGAPAVAFVDTHCHLDAAEFDEDRDAVIAAARAVGVVAMIVPGVHRPGMDAVEALCARRAECRPAYGIHPLFVGAAGDDDLVVLEARLDRPEVVAVGEIGLDFFDPSADRARQQHFFAAQLGIARRRGLPVLLHIRRAQDAVLAALRRAGVCGGIAHAFNGSMQQARAFIDLGFRLGFGGAMSHERARRIRELATKLPLSAIVLETDAPDIPPAWRENRRSEPADIARSASVLADLRGQTVAEVGVATTANAAAALPRLRALLGLPG